MLAWVSLIQIRKVRVALMVTKLSAKVFLGLLGGSYDD
jgi:hypothetical protein